MTPMLGLRLAEVAANIDARAMCLRLEDMFITGMLRDHIEGTSVKQIAGGISGYLWNNYLSHNRLISDFNYVFFNDIVLEKNFYIKSFWFWSCGWFEEYVLGTLQFFIP